MILSSHQNDDDDDDNDDDGGSGRIRTTEARIEPGLNTLACRIRKNKAELVEQRRGGGSSVPRPNVCVGHHTDNRLRKYHGSGTGGGGASKEGKAPSRIENG